MNVQIDSVVKRSRGYWFVDGFTEIAVGLLFILLAGMVLIRAYTTQGSPASRFPSITGEIVIVKVLGGITAFLILWWLKDHFTYPRTGFVRGNQVTKAQIVLMIRSVFLFLVLPIFGLLVAASLIISTGNVLSSMPSWFPAGVGFIWSTLCILAGQWMNLRRFHVLGVMVLLTGAAVGIWQFMIGLPEMSTNVGMGISQPEVLESINRTLSSLGVLMLITGVFIILSGLVTFLQYRKENPSPYTEDV